MKNHLEKTCMGLFAVILTVILLGGNCAFALDASSQGDNNSAYLQSVMDMIKEQYGGQPTDDQLVQGALDGMLNALDPYTTFYTPKEEDSFMKSVGGTYAGIGISIELSGSNIMISKVFSSSPAEKAGLVQGDIIAEVDGKSMAGKTPDDAAAMITGQSGTKVKLGIARVGSKDLLTFEIVRDTIRINPVTYEIRDGIGYIKLDMFNENTAENFTKALAVMDSNNVTKLVLDLRSNPGGEVNQAVAVARAFVPAGLITKLDYKSDTYTDVIYRSYLAASKYKLAVLVNGMSASASEIVSGAIQDTGAGTLIGTKTFGKAKFQGLIPMLTPAAYEKYKEKFGQGVVSVYDLEEKYNVTPLESEIEGYTKITLGYYYTPKGRMIDGTGLTPDISVTDPEPFAGVDVTSVQTLAATTKFSLNSQGGDVTNAEKILKILGYDIGTPDSTLDIKTFNAIKKFQKDIDGFPYGVLDFNTQKALNGAFEKLLPSLDKQYAKALEVLNRM